MLTINDNTKKTLKDSLVLYYDALSCGDLIKLSTLMTRESYLITLEVLGFKHAFRNDEFKKLFKNIDSDENSLQKVESLISNDLAHEKRKHLINVISFESKGTDRVTVHYIEDTHPKKQYFSFSSDGWKIDYKAGRKKHY
ncbi:hypothetical protein HUE87_03475 [Candidatus Sulfurimonas marisnigri]|uniref:DUF4878 domain-containing protein n=1 Tax=Candidatus Sulfurimonas marisnigri TaxID=2740405 RepID=A0A7S7M1B2_9BACT|nr:hypothetical protein [Candidatus Sulfurimonas marisnigri]QOY55311.1 hypothetical protein HUE87_03475 [Candidatus Sulfurimonas marisnigri]